MLGRWLLFLSSYSPLFGLLAVRTTETLAFRLSLTLCLIGVAVALLVEVEARAGVSQERYVTSVEDGGSDVAGYLATYLLPFLTVTNPSVRDLVAVGMFVVIVGVVYTNSSLLGVNPLLFLFRYRLSYVTTQVAGERLLFLGRQKPVAGDRVAARPLMAAHGIVVGKVLGRGTS